MRTVAPTFTRRIACVGLAVVATTTAAFVGAAPNAADAVPSHASADRHAATKRVVSARTPSRFAMPAPGLATVQSVKLAAGSWSVIGKATAVDEGSSDFVRCALADQTHGTQLDSATAFLGNSGTHAGVLTDIATIVVAPGATVRVIQQCGHDGTAGNTAYIDSDASVVAFPTLDGTAAGQTFAHTTANTSLATSGGPMLSLALDSGTYAVGLKLTAVTFSGNATVTCVLYEGSNYTAAVVTSIGTSTAAATNAYFTYSTGFDSVSVQCSEQGAAGAYIDPSAVLWARKVKAVTAVEAGCGARLVNGTTDLVVLERSGASCTIGGGTQTQLSAASVAKGTYVVLSSEAAVVSSDGVSDDLRCLLAGQGLELDGSSAWDAPSQYYGETMVATMKLTGPGGVSENCGRDGEGTEAITTTGSLVLIRI